LHRLDVEGGNHNVGESVMQPNLSEFLSHHLMKVFPIVFGSFQRSY